MAKMINTADGARLEGVGAGALLTYLQSLHEPGADTPATISTVSVDGDTTTTSDTCEYEAVSGAAAGHVVAKKAPAVLRTGGWAIPADGTSTSTCWYVGTAVAKHITDNSLV